VAGRVEKAAPVHFKLQRVYAALNGIGTWPASLKAALDLVGKRGGYPRAPILPLAPADRERIRANRRRIFVGSPRTVRERIEPLLAATAADELMITTMVHDHAARKRSYELLAEVFALDRAPVPRFRSS